MMPNKVLNILVEQQIALQNNVIRRVRALGCKVIAVHQDAHMTIEIDHAPPRDKINMFSSLIIIRNDVEAVFTACIDGIQVMWRAPSQQEVA